MTDEQLIKELRQMAFIYGRKGECRREAILNQVCMRLEQQRDEIKQYRRNQEELIVQRDWARLDCAVAESNHQTAVNDFKSALLKKIFPYNAADKKQYSINAYAVEKAIEEVAEKLIGGNH